MQYAPYFNVQDARHNLGTVTFSHASLPDFSVDITAMSYVTLEGSTSVTIFNHHELAFVVDEDGESDPNISRLLPATGFSNVVTGHMYTAANAAGWPDASPNLDCAFDGSLYTFHYYGDAFSAIRFSNIHTMRLFGFADDFAGSAETVEGTRLPNFLINPELSAITMRETEGYIYEPTGISTSAISAGGVQFGLTRSAVPRYRDFVQQAEPRAKVLREHAVSTHPFTHQLLFESCRSVIPFAVINGFDDGLRYLFKLRPQGCVWDLKACTRVGGEMDHAIFNVNYRVQQLGTFSGAA